MINDTTGLKAFSNETPGLQTAWDSTSLGLLKECPRKYLYSIIEGWQPRKTSVHLTFGQYYHSALERYDHARAAGADHEDALDIALAYALEVTVVRLPNGSWRPWQSDEPNKNRETLIRTIVWYLEQFKSDAAETVILANGKPAVELSFRFELDFKIESQPAMLCGHLDRLVEFNSQIMVMDHKTTKLALDERYFLGFNPDNQMTLYTLASQVVYGQPVRGVIIDAAQVMVTFSRFQRGFTHRHHTELDEWLGEAQYYIKNAEGFAHHSFWPKNDKSCGMYGGCPFRPVCATAPKMRETILKASFHRRVWDPLEVRGDI